MLFNTKLVGTTQVQLVKQESTRTSLVVYNNSANNLYIGMRLQNTEGFLIPPGGSASFKIPEDDPTQDLWAIASGAGSDIRIYEGFGGLRR